MSNLYVKQKANKNDKPLHIAARLGVQTLTLLAMCIGKEQCKSQANLYVCNHIV